MSLSCSFRMVRLSIALVSKDQQIVSSTARLFRIGLAVAEMTPLGREAFPNLSPLGLLPTTAEMRPKKVRKTGATKLGTAEFGGSEVVGLTWQAGEAIVCLIPPRRSDLWACLLNP